MEEREEGGGAKEGVILCIPIVDYRWEMMLLHLSPEHVAAYARKMPWHSPAVVRKML